MCPFLCPLGPYHRHAGLHFVARHLETFGSFRSLVLNHFFLGLIHSTDFMIAWLAITLFGTTIS